MSNNLFKSVLSDYMNAFIKEKRQRGFLFQTGHRDLMRFDTYLYMNHITQTYISKDLCDGFVQFLYRTNCAKSVHNIMCTVGQFSMYLCDLGVESYIPQSPRHQQTDFQSYIYSKNELNAIFAAADNYREKINRHPSVMFIMPALLRTLYSTGIRIGEALSIQNKDVDFSRHIIVLNKTKNNHQRIAPINPSLETVLKQYMEYRNKIGCLKIAAPQEPFFVNTLGKSPIENVVYYAFRRILDLAGVKFYGKKLGPNLHSFRHTACVHAMEKMINDGMDMYCCIPILSTFMGHNQVSDTQDYIRVTKEIFPSILAADESITNSISNVIAYALIEENNEHE